MTPMDYTMLPWERWADAGTVSCTRHSCSSPVLRSLCSFPQVADTILSFKSQSWKLNNNLNVSVLGLNLLWHGGGWDDLIGLFLLQFLWTIVLGNRWFNRLIHICVCPLCCSLYLLYFTWLPWEEQIDYVRPDTQRSNSAKSRLWRDVVNREGDDGE